MRKFSEEIRRVRKLKDTTLRTVSEQTGVSIGYLSGLERGEEDNPSAKTIIALCRYYGLPMSNILSRIDHQQRASKQ